MIDIKNISIIKNNKVILKNINLTINDGDFIYLIGKNGSGKTTFSNVLSGLEKNYNGSIIFNDEIINKNDDDFFEENIGYVFQNPNNQFITSIVENDLAFGLEKKKMSYYEVKKRINSILEEMEISHLVDRNISTLSGGEKQRIALASMLLLEKKLIIFDESISMLDPYNSKKIIDLIEKVNINKKVTILFITHNLKRIKKIENSRVVEIIDGEIYEQN